VRARFVRRQLLITMWLNWILTIDGSIFASKRVADMIDRPTIKVRRSRMRYNKRERKGERRENNPSSFIFGQSGWRISRIIVLINTSAVIT